MGIYQDGGIVQVRYAHLESIPISRILYERRSYWPPFNELPSKEEYVARNAKAQL